MTLGSTYRPTQSTKIERHPPREAGDEDRLVSVQPLMLDRGSVRLVVERDHNGRPQVTTTTILLAHDPDRADEDGDPLLTMDIESAVRTDPDLGWDPLVFFARQILALAGR